MAVENVRKFEEKIKDDEALQERLRELVEAYDGDKDNSKAIFEAVIVPVAAEAGLPYTYDEALEALAQESDNEDLDADELKAVAGGISDACWWVGFGEVSANTCTQGEQIGFNACAGVGVGLIAS